MFKLKVSRICFL